MKSKSICITCKYERTCIFKQYTKNPVFHCEEYELVPTQTNQVQINSIEVKEELSVTEYTGICTNCDYKMECNIRCETSVLWHCEEYI